MNAKAPELKVRLDYSNLWKLLIDKQKKKEDLERAAEVSSTSVVRLNKGENVTTETLLRICQYLEYDVADICRVVATAPRGGDSSDV